MSRIRQIALLALAAYVVSRVIPRRHKEMEPEQMREREAMEKKRAGSAA